jgi:hypothetical protein
MAAMRSDPVVAAHYAGLPVSKLQLRSLAGPVEAYVSYRKDNGILWTRRPVVMRSGETVLAGEDALLRARCGNRISMQPREPVAPAGEEPDPKELETPVIEAQVPRVPLPEILSLLEPAIAIAGRIEPSNRHIPGLTSPTPGLLDPVLDTGPAGTAMAGVQTYPLVGVVSSGSGGGGGGGGGAGGFAPGPQTPVIPAFPTVPPSAPPVLLISLTLPDLVTGPEKPIFMAHSNIRPDTPLAQRVVPALPPTAWPISPLLTTFGETPNPAFPQGPPLPFPPVATPLPPDVPRVASAKDPPNDDRRPPEGPPPPGAPPVPVPEPQTWIMFLIALIAITVGRIRRHRLSKTDRR